MNITQYQGFVIFVLYNKGSKSECLKPVLLTENGSTCVIFKGGDNPFTSESLKEYHLSFCEIQGKYDDKKNFIAVLEIKKIADPAQKAWQSSSQQNGNENPIMVKRDKSHV